MRFVNGVPFVFVVGGVQVGCRNFEIRSFRCDKARLGARKLDERGIAGPVRNRNQDFVARSEKAEACVEQRLLCPGRYNDTVGAGFATGISLDALRDCLAQGDDARNRSVLVEALLDGCDAGSACPV